MANATQTGRAKMVKEGGCPWGMETIFRNTMALNTLWRQRSFPHGRPDLETKNDL
jgi:hypothetical protein